MKKKFLSTAILSAMVLSFAACGDTPAAPVETAANPSAATDTAAVTEPEITDNLPDTDLGGYDFSIFHFDESWLTWAKTQLDAEAENGELLNDAIYARNRTIEERFNCNINIFEQEMVQASDVQKEVMAGDSTYDVWLTYDIWLLGCIQYLMPFENLPYIDLNAEWWNPLATNVFTLRGDHYAAAGNYSLSVLSRASGFAFNKTIYNNLDMGYSLYELVNSGKWTIDKLFEIAQASYSDLNGNGQIDEGDLFGIGGSWKEFYNRMMLGSGIQYVAKDSDDFPVFTLPTDEGAINKIQYIYDLFQDKRVYNNLGNNVDNSGGMGDFKNETQLFVVDNLLGLENKRSYDIDIGFIPTPKFDEAQTQYYAPAFGAEVSILLKTLPEEKWETVGLLLEAMAFETNKSVIPMYKEVLLKTKYARDNESESMIDIIIDSISFEFGLNAWQETVANPLVTGVFMKNGNIASTLAKMEKSVANEIKKLDKNLGQ
ncbi:MAG: hypothetical protein MJ175_05340 [Clostridia bacterium]|nr:hypothetical protein [Clostridia bacterium]